ncbi:hypothetical protein SDC9_49212 [bioreactor metagenome]|uniref:Uncharacterized protein n=1 Tax=bioreactor metagenome TaxID=1076179 RepID=A0A644WKL2_9ZZZZ
MNVYLFELKAQLKSAALWTAVILALLSLLMAAVYPVYYESRAEAQAVMEGFPPQFAAAFGLTLETIFSYRGFYSFGFFYLSLLGGIMASGLTLSVFAREKRSKCADFLLVKPRSRSGVFCSKLLACLTVLTAVNILFIAFGVVLYRVYGRGEASSSRAALASSALFFTQIVFLAVSAFAAVFAKKVRSVSGAATAIGLAGFLLSALHGILRGDALRYIAPLKYFDVSRAFSEGAFETRYVVTAVVLTALLLAASFFRYLKSDVPAA